MIIALLRKLLVQCILQYRIKTSEIIQKFNMFTNISQTCVPIPLYPDLLNNNLGKLKCYGCRLSQCESKVQIETESNINHPAKTAPRLSILAEVLAPERLH
jgi:hypothetical protein